MEEKRWKKRDRRKEEKKQAICPQLIHIGHVRWEVGILANKFKFQVEWLMERWLPLHTDYHHSRASWPNHGPTCQQSLRGNECVGTRLFGSYQNLTNLQSTRATSESRTSNSGIRIGFQPHFSTNNARILFSSTHPTRRNVLAEFDLAGHFRRSPLQIPVPNYICPLQPRLMIEAGHTDPIRQDLNERRAVHTRWRSLERHHSHRRLLHWHRPLLVRRFSPTHVDAAARSGTHEPPTHEPPTHEPLPNERAFPSAAPIDSGMPHGPPETGEHFGTRP